MPGPKGGRGGLLAPPLELGTHLKDSLAIIAAELRENLAQLDPGVDQLIRALLELRERDGWLHLNAAGRSGEVAALFGLQLTNLGFKVQRLLPGQLFSHPRKGDIALHISGSGSTLPTNLILEITKRIPVQNIALTAKPEAPSWQQGLDLILQVPGRTKLRTKLREGAAEERIARALPLGSAFELTCALLLRGVVMALPIGGNIRGVRDTINRLLEEAEGLSSRIDEETTAKLLNNLITAYHEDKHVFVGGLNFSNHLIEMFAHRLEQLGFRVASLFSRRLPRAHAGDLLLLLSPDPEAKDERGLQAIAKAARQDGLQIGILHASSQGRVDSDLSVPIPTFEPWWWSALLYLESVVSALMAKLNKKEGDLVHSQAWLG